ncbi:MAG: methylmalonyl Co-A mutase-associated GTPase MeaB [Acidobacteriota bacterium]|nr:methylmalonyl Co-A mutase-associated GTPase MeaB [Acidobacteriota bacterium]
MSEQIDIASTLTEGVLAGRRRALARTITLIESTRPDDREQANNLLARLLPHAGKAVRVGISGVPGVGKSTFIEALGLFLIEKGHRVAVLAVDPSSKISGGSILGDKVRMELLSREEAAFIRPSPSSGSLGGVTRRTRETMIACEAAGYDVILVETVGVGQSEVTVAEMVDFFMVLLLPGAGDEIQGIKKGIIELADGLVVNKADGELETAAGRAVRHYRNALHFTMPKLRDYTVPILKTSALKGEGIDEVWTSVLKHRAFMKERGLLTQLRRTQNHGWFHAALRDGLLDRLYANGEVHQRMQLLAREMDADRKTPHQCADELIAFFLDRAGE